MIPIPSSVRVWLATGTTDMRRGMNGLALQVQQVLGRDPHVGDLYVFRGKRGDLIKVLWHDGLGMSLYAKRLERGASCGHRRRTAWCRLPRHNSGTCWRVSTGGIRSGPGGLRWPADGGCGGVHNVACVWLNPAMSSGAIPSSVELDVLRTALATEQTARREAEARASGAEAMVAHLKLLIAKLRHERFGASSERSRKLLDQMELQIEELEAAASEDEAAVTAPAAGERGARRRPVRGPLPAHLPRERVVLPGPTACPCCGGRLSKLGEDVTETLEVVPRQWKVVQTVREKFACRACEAITQPPAPFHPIARGRAGPNLLATILEAKFGQHLPLNRQSESFAREGIELDVSTLADWVGACTATLAPLVALLRAHVLAGERLHGDDTTVPVLATGRTTTGRLWVYVRDDRPFAGPAPPAALFHYSPDRKAEHPWRHLQGWRGILQADAYAGFNELYASDRQPGPVAEAGCWAHARRKFFDLAELSRAPLALEAVRRIDVLFAIERDLIGLPAGERLAQRQLRSAILLEQKPSDMNQIGFPDAVEM